MKTLTGIIFLFLMLQGLSYGQRNQLMPNPREIRYGRSLVPVKGITIGFENQPSAEDRFAARELSRILSKACGTEILIMESPEVSAFLVFERTGDPSPLPLPGEKTGKGSREYYEISIRESGIRLSSVSSAGLFYAVQTLRQMVEYHDGEAFLPEAGIADWPAYAYRGFMMDMSHTQLPKKEEIKRQLDFLAMWKANQYYFYSEASIELEGYPLLMADARFTRQEVREIIDYGRERHIDVIPNMELYGHLHDLFRLERYSDLAVIPHGGEFRPQDPRVAPLLEDWITQIAGLFPSPFFHIGFDETWLIHKEAEKLGIAAEELYLKMLNQTAEIVGRNGKTCMYYADMLQKFPSIISEVPRNTVAIAWHYFPKEKQEYEPLMNPFREEGIGLFVQPATINWFSVVPSFTTSFRNIPLLIEMGREYDAEGFILSGWTDDIQTMMRQSFPDLALGSSSAWQQEPVDIDRFFGTYASLLYGAEAAPAVERALTALMRAEDMIAKAVGAGGGTDVALFANPFTEERLRMIRDHGEELRQGRLEAENAQESLLEVLDQDNRFGTLSTFYYGAKTLDYIALKYLYAGEIHDFWKELEKDPENQELRRWFRMEISFKYHTRTSDLMDAITVLKDLFEKTWRDEYTDFRLGIGLGKYDQELGNWLNLQKSMERRVNFHKEDPFPSLEEYFR